MLFNTLALWEKNKSSFDGKPSIGLSNCSDSRGTFCGKNVFFGKIIIIFSDFQNLSECVFCRKFAGKFVKVHSGCPGEHFQAAFFSFFEQKTFRLSANVSRPPEDHFEYWFERITLLFITYSHKKSSFGGQLTTGLSKRQSGCLGEFSEGKQLFWKKYMFFPFIFALRTKFFQKLDAEVSVRLSELHFTCLGEESEQKQIFWKVFIFLSFS